MRKSLLGVCCILIFFIFLYVLHSLETCPLSLEKKIVRGYSLDGIVSNGTEVGVFVGYYQCHPVKRGDLVVYQYFEDDSVIKIAKGVPGDMFSFQKAEGGWYLLLNDAIVRNSQEIPYLIDEQGYALLSLYHKDYHGKIPEDTYLLLGNQLRSFDSRRFGLVHQDAFLGKVVL